MTIGLARLLVLAVAVGCSRPDSAPAQLQESASPFAGSRDPTVRAAAALLADGHSWRATEVIDSVYRERATRSPEVTLVAATAAAAWGGWSRVERDLANAPWLDTLLDGLGRELLARAALARGADSLARRHAELSLASARTNRERGTREILLARALDRQAIGDSAASMYLRAARHLPAIADWLELRAAGATSDASRRQRSYARISGPAARARIAPTEAQARERWRDFSGAARAYAELGDKGQELRLRLLASPDSTTKATVRAEALTLLRGDPSASDARAAIALVDSLSPLTDAENVVVARAAGIVGLLPRAASGFARADRTLDAATRYAYATVLARLGRDADAAAQFARVPSTAPLGPMAAYQRARSLLRAGQGSTARAALQRVAGSYPRDTNVAAPALFLLADLATDDARDTQARTGFLDVARRYPTSELAPASLFRAAMIAYAAGTFDTAARDFDALVERFPRSMDATAARYGGGRARERLGDRRRATERWQSVIATDPLSYYAVRSAARLGVPAEPAPPSDSSPLPPALTRSLQRAELLDATGMSTEEGFEYDAIANTSSSPDSLLAAADALRQAGEVSRAMALARRAVAGGVTRDTRALRLMYPIAYEDVIRVEAASHRVEPTLVAALIHQESGFNPRATSRAGAVGLMQVLPSVGADVARAERMTSYDRVLLYQPDVNVRLGMAHLDAMLRQYPRVEYALAAYNAGGAPVRRWRQKRGTDDPEVFIERIPYDETRDYVRILLRNQAVYRTLYRW
jgi:soluble lytic murein transglycosylase